MNRPEDNWRSFEKFIKIWSDCLSGLGMSPITFYRNQKDELLCRISPWKMVISVIIFIFFIAIFVIQIMPEEFPDNNPRIAFIVGCIKIMGGADLILRSGSVIWNSRSYAALITKFLRFNRCISVRPQSSSVVSLRYFSIYSLIYISSLLIDIVLYTRRGGPFTFAMAVTYIPGLYGLFSLWHFAVCCLWLREYLWSINRQVEKCSQSYISRAEFSKVSDVYPESVERLSEVSVNTLRGVRRQYHEVYIMAHAVNSVYATRNLLIVAENFVYGTTLIYCALDEFFDYMNNDSGLSIIGILDYVTWSIMSFLLICGVVGPCNKVYLEAHDTVLRVQQFYTKSSGGAVQLELHSFVMQLFHEKIIFSPHGFFKINNKLLLSVIGAVASYLVVLIQFRIALSNQ